MSENKKDGEAAFPVPGDSFYSGMSLREWFAGQALQGVLSNNEEIEAMYKEADENGLLRRKFVALQCYKMADAMIEQGDE